jgi:hypothetical protein
VPIVLKFKALTSWNPRVVARDCFAFSIGHGGTWLSWDPAWWFGTAELQETDHVAYRPSAGSRIFVHLEDWTPIVLYCVGPRPFHESAWLPEKVQPLWCRPCCPKTIHHRPAKRQPYFISQIGTELGYACTVMWPREIAFADVSADVVWVQSHSSPICVNQIRSHNAIKIECIQCWFLATHNS